MIKIAEFCRKGHPDRLSDIIADALLDEYLKRDSNARVALEVFGCHGVITIGGEITTNSHVEIAKVVRDVYQEIGYQDNVGIHVNIKKQSPEIKKLADVGAGDSGITTGYATDETPEMLPKEVVIAKQVCSALDDLSYLKPDGKVQVVLDGNEVIELIVSVQAEKKFRPQLEKFLKSKYPSKKLHLTLFQTGGFDADTGLTGRKNVLWYGPRIPIGGGSFAGKDATKVDRSGAYWTRWKAKKAIEELGYSDCLFESSYVIGKSEPLAVRYWGTKDGKSVYGEDFGGIPLRVLIKKLGLKKPIYKQASLLGHFGNQILSWEK